MYEILRNSPRFLENLFPKSFIHKKEQALIFNAFLMESFIK